MLGFLATKRIDDPYAHPGILLAGKVLSLAAAGDKFAVKLAVGTAMREIEVVTNQNPQDLCDVDDTVVVLGTIERNPSAVKGYEGPAELIVVNSYLQKVQLSP